MRGQRVHRLRPRDARNEFHREGVDLGLGQCVEHGFVAIRLQQRCKTSARLHRADFGIGRAAHFCHQVGRANTAIGGDLGACRLVEIVGKARARPSAGLHHNAMAEAHELFHRVRRGGNARLSGRAFLENGDPQRSAYHVREDRHDQSANAE